jgi:hypothetical protein
VQVFVGAFSGGDGTAEVTLKGFDGNHKLINSSTATVSAGNGFKTPLAVVSSAASIAFFEVSAPATGSARIGIDDLSFDVPVIAPPDFAVSSPQSIQVRQGASAELKITITRFNGSTGSVRFAITGLPAGVTAAFAPRQSVGGSAPEQVTLTLTAASNAPPTGVNPAGAVVTGAPQELIADVPGEIHLLPSGAGPGPRIAPLAVAVQPNFVLTLQGKTAIAIPECGSADVPVSVVRASGFNDVVSLRVDGLPPGVRATFDPASAGIPAGGAVANQLKLTLASIPGVNNNTLTAQITASSGSLPPSSLPLSITTVYSSCGLQSGAVGNGRGCFLTNIAPEWVSVEPADTPKIMEGMVVESRPAGNDNMAVHSSMDWNAFVELDAKYAHLNSDINVRDSIDAPEMRDVNGKTIPAHRALVVEMEWETAYLDPRFRPKAGDRAWMIGRWIFDCGHPESAILSAYTTEMHPPQAVSFTRSEPHVFSGDTSAVAANVSYIYVYGRGSGKSQVLSESLSIFFTVSLSSISISSHGTMSLTFRFRRNRQHLPFSVWKWCSLCRLVGHCLR